MKPKYSKLLSPPPRITITMFHSLLRLSVGLTNVVVDKWCKETCRHFLALVEPIFMSSFYFSNTSSLFFEIKQVGQMVKKQLNVPLPCTSAILQHLVRRTLRTTADHRTQCSFVECYIYASIFYLFHISRVANLPLNTLAFVPSFHQVHDNRRKV
jgi:hypothetical protein